MDFAKGCPPKYMVVSCRHFLFSLVSLLFVISFYLSLSPSLSSASEVEAHPAGTVSVCQLFQVAPHASLILLRSVLQIRKWNLRTVALNQDNFYPPYSRRKLITSSQRRKLGRFLDVESRQQKKSSSICSSIECLRLKRKLQTKVKKFVGSWDFFRTLFLRIPLAIIRDASILSPAHLKRQPPALNAVLRREIFYWRVAHSVKRSAAASGDDQLAMCYGF